MSQVPDDVSKIVAKYLSPDSIFLPCKSEFIQTYNNTFIRKSEIDRVNIKQEYGGYYQIQIHPKDNRHEICYSFYNTKQEADDALKKLMQEEFGCKIRF